ncbi:hypothetical protein K439DRAFT_1638699 [Ramaria rubella]|nr:hypothetical protein K439DRAFT_1638699 [Ramaria rubella]
MVLGFGSKKKKQVAEPVVIRTSPSLPELAQQRIPWPEDLVDVNAVHAFTQQSPPHSEGHRMPHGASKTSFQGTRVPFHKPFRTGDGSTPSSPQPGGIAALFGTGVPPPPSAFNGVGSRSRVGSHGRSTRRAKYAPTFNVMVAGAKQTGKSSLLRLILDTSTISPINTPEQLTSLSTFHSSSVRPTTSINSACVEILQGAITNRTPGPEDRINLTCIDTPGLDFSEGKEFALDRAVSSVVRYVDQQFAETMGEESKVIRASKGDQHVHLCIYLIDPDSVMTPSARRARSRLAASAFPAQPLSPSDLPEPSEYESGSDDSDFEADDGSIVHETVDGSDDGYGESEPVTERLPLTPISPDDKTPRNSMNPSSLENGRPTPPESPPKTQSQPQTPHKQPRTQTQAQTQTQNRLGMCPAEIRVIARLSKRVNVLPIVARADTLTDGRLARVKRAIRRDLQSVGVEDDSGGDGLGNGHSGGGIFAVWDADTGSLFSLRSPSKGIAAPVTADVDDERQSRPVIKLRERAQRGLTRSRSRRSLKSVVGAEYDEPDIEASPGYPVPTSPGTDYGTPSRRTSVASATSAATSPPVGTGSGPAYGAMFSRTDLRARMPFAIIAPERERGSKKAGKPVNGHGHTETHVVQGRFVRRFRWGTIDVLDPQHCDFAALRAAVLGSYMRTLKATTKDILYERFRTEKLLARRATANISDSDRKRIMQDLGL